MPRKYVVTAFLPSTVELSRRNTKDALTIKIEGGDKPGTLVLNQGSVEWWPAGNSVNERRASWDKFAKMCEKHMREKRDGKRPKK